MLAVVSEDALAGVDEENKGGVEHGEDEVEGETDEEELANLQPLEVKEALTERMLEKMIVTSLDEGHEHGALPLALVRNQNLVVQLQLAVHIVDVVLGESDGLVQHVLELGQHARDLPHDHGQCSGASISAGGDVSSIAEEEVGTACVLIESCDVKRSVAKLVLVINIGPSIQQHLDTLVRTETNSFNITKHLHHHTVTP